jgi:SSS family solute:Na+ symporter
LYWKKGTTAGAWSGVIIGSSLAFTGIIVPWWVGKFPDQVKSVIAGTPHFVGVAINNFPNGIQMKSIAEASAIVVYVVVSLLTCRKDHDMDKLLHRGKYAVASDQELKVAKKKRTGMARLLDFSDDFTFWDKVVAGGVFFWSMAWLTMVIGGSTWNLTSKSPWSAATWANFWFVAGVLVPLGIGLFTLVWFSIGGTMDLIYFFRKLSTMRRDSTDDGMVRHHQTPEHQSA